MNDITVASIELVSHEKIKAVASIRIGCLIIHGVKVMAKEGGELWVALPSVKRGDAWNPVVEIKSRPLMQAITDACIDACRFEASAKHTLDVLNADGGFQRPRAALSLRS